MMAKSRACRSRSIPVFLILLSLTALSPAASRAQVAKTSNDTLSSLAFQSERLAPSQPLSAIDEVLSAVAGPTSGAWQSFRLAAPVEWRAAVDRRTGVVGFAEGGNIAWVPGRGNRLTVSDLAPLLRPGTKKVDLAALEAIARAYLPKVAGMLGVDPKSLVLSLGRSGQPASHLWFVDFDVKVDGAIVEGARVVFRVNNGNLIQFGTENLPAPGSPAPIAAAAAIPREKALAAVAKTIGGFSSADGFLDGGSLHLVPVNLPSPGSAEGLDFGAGRGLARIWQFTFHRDGVLGTWRARVDAASGEVLALEDVNEYAQATGGVYQNSPATGSEVVRPMPYADLSAGGFANSAGLYIWNGNPLTSILSGQYVRITDTCGALSQGSDGAGNLPFGTSAGTDCATPGHGGAGNTHASREQFYQVNRIKEVGRGWLPGNAWLSQQLTVNVNLNQVCNAYWNGSTLNFFRSGGGCSNTGEIAGVSLHEYGHGLDQNDGTGTAPEGGTGESYADITATIALHSSCVGPGFLGGNCGGYGDACTACTGVRDIDYARHASNTPATVANFTQPRCGSGSGPCGREVHCESYVPSEAVWDFANRDLPNPGTGPAWTILDRLWYLSRNSATSSFTCHTGTTFTSDGCGTGNWWEVMRAVDDDDGNLSNGTPHGGALFAAFNRHGIACPTDPGAGTTFAGCAAPAAPALTVYPGVNAASLSWTASGGAVYDVFRNETGCNAGFTKIASGTGATTLSDSAVANTLTYYYQVTAFPSGNEACASAPSACVAVTPSSLPSLPTSLGAVLQWGAQNPSLGHIIGRADSGGWSVNVAQDSPGFLQYGPYTATVPVGDNVALWNLLIDNNSADNGSILILDVNDATTQTQIASRTITRQQFAAANSFQIFAVPFAVDGSRAGHAWEFRAYWLGGAYVREQAVGFANLQWNAQNAALGHVIGRADADGWSVNVAQDSQGFMQYGPYTGSVPAGNNVALWTILIDNNSANNADTLVLDVNDATTQTRIASRTLTRQAFTAPNVYQTFGLPFTVDASRSGHVWEFRAYWLGGAYVREQAVGYIHTP